jgi:hypothetical protein
MTKQIVFVGKPYYATKKLIDLKRQGYVVVKKTDWEDGKSSTYVMEKNNE